MIFARFLHYLRPYRARIALSIAAMVLVGFLGAANILIMIPALRVILSEAGPGGAGTPGAADTTLSAPAIPGAVDPAAPAPDSPAVDSQPLPVPESVAPAAPVSPPVPADADEISSSDMIPERVRQVGERARDFGERVFGPAIAAFQERRAEVETWYRRKAASDPFGLLLVIALVLVSVTAIKAALDYISKLNLAYVFYQFTLGIQQDIFARILEQDFLFFLDHSPGYLMSRIKSDVNTIRSVLNRVLHSGIKQPINLVFYSAALVWLSPQLTLVMVFVLPVVGYLIYSFSRTLRKNVALQKEQSDELAGFTTEALYNFRLVKTFGTEEREIEKFVQRRRSMFRVIMAKRIAKFASGPVMEMVGTLGACGVLLLGGYIIIGEGGWMRGSLDPAEFFAYLFLLTRFYRPIRGLSKTMIQYQTALISGERVLEMLALEPHVVEARDAKPLREMAEGVEFRDVSLRYNEKQILDGVTLSIPRGKFVALVGHAGSGKTSVANLLARLFDPSEGGIFIDGVDLRDTRTADLRAALGIVTQQTILFDDTVAKNITYGARLGELGKDEVRERVVAAARDADADGFIGELDGGRGYETMVGPGGAKLSGGQAQRIAIARALLRRPQIMIFDEATSALDPVSQGQVQEAMLRILKHSTALVISHRLSTIREADLIYVLGEGRVVEQGTHDELMERRGEYFQFVMSEQHEAGAA